jgi:hypothetical protein
MRKNWRKQFLRSKIFKKEILRLKVALLTCWVLRKTFSKLIKTPLINSKIKALEYWNQGKYFVSQSKVTNSRYKKTRHSLTWAHHLAKRVYNLRLKIKNKFNSRKEKHSNSRNLRPLKIRIWKTLLHSGSKKLKRPRTCHR